MPWHKFIEEYVVPEAPSLTRRPARTSQLAVPQARSRQYPRPRTGRGNPEGDRGKSGGTDKGKSAEVRFHYTFTNPYGYQVHGLRAYMDIREPLEESHQEEQGTQRTLIEIDVHSWIPPPVWMSDPEDPFADADELNVLPGEPYSYQC